MPVSIILSRPATKPQLFTTNICRFYAEEKPHFIHRLSFCEHSTIVDDHRIGKFGEEIDKHVYKKVSSFSVSLGSLASKAEKGTLYYQEACRYWAKASSKQPFFRKNGRASIPSHWRRIPMISKEAAAFATCILNSSLFYWYYSAFSDCEHINDGLVRRFPVPGDWSASGHEWTRLCADLMTNLNSNARRKSILTKQGHVIEYDEISGGSSKEWIDQIDQALADIYSLTDTELDYIVQYDIKYRSGLDGTTPPTDV